MSTVSTVVGVSKVGGPLGFDLYAMRFDVQVTGAYSSAGDPNFDMLAAIQAHMHQGISAVSVKSIALYQDGIDGISGARITAPNADGALSGTGNKVYTFELWTGTGATDGDQGSGAEVVDTTVLDVTVSFLAVMTM